MAKEHRMHDVVGCVYPSPVPDDGLKLPERNEDLRAFQVVTRFIRTRVRVGVVIFWDVW